MKNPLIVYHKGCMDGAGAALAAWLKFGAEAEYRAASYGDPAPTDEEVRGRDVYVLDFSYPRVELQRMYTVNAHYFHDGCNIPRNGSIIVLDHHKTAQADLAGLPFCKLEVAFSGAVLAWSHFHGKGFDGVGWPSALEVPELFLYIQDRDLWRWELPHSREVSAALAASGALEDFRKLIPIFQHWQKTNEPDVHFEWRRAGYESLCQDGAAILRAQEQLVARAVEGAEEVEIDGLRALAVSCPLLQSEIGDALALESARRGRDPVGVVYYRDGKAGKWRVSLRSRVIVESGRTSYEGSGSKIPDVSAVAKNFGGGGHARAAGFECDELPWSKK